MNDIVNAAVLSRLLEQGDPAADGRAFRRCLGQYPTGVTIITAQNGERTVGMAVNSFAAVSLDPPLVLWSIRRESKSAQDFLEAGHFAVNILADDQVEVSQLFGASHPERFSLTPWQAGACGAPLLDGAIAHLECRRVAVHEGGDHLILIGHVDRYVRFEGGPLVFAQGQYAVTGNHPSLGAPAGVPAAAPVADESEVPFLKLLSLTTQRMSALFEEHRQVLGVTTASTRILHRLSQGACDPEALERATYLGTGAVEDALGDLTAQGHVLREPGGLLKLTDKGQHKREAVARKSAQFTQEKLQGIPASSIAAAREVLEALLQK